MVSFIFVESETEKMNFFGDYRVEALHIGYHWAPASTRFAFSQRKTLNTLVSMKSPHSLVTYNNIKKR